MNTTNASTTPLWLELKTHYIDDNFEQLLPYLKRNINKDDSFLQTTIRLLGNRAKEVIDDISQRSIFIDEKPMHDDRLRNIRILSAYLLADPGSDFRHATYIAMLSELKVVASKFSDSLTKKLTESLRYKYIYHVGISWDDISSFHPEIFATKVVGYSEFNTLLPKELVYADKGTAILTKEGFTIIPEIESKAKKIMTSGAESIHTGLGLRLRTLSEDKLKLSQCEDIDEIHTFMIDFVDKQKNVTPNAPQKTLKSYANDDEAIVVITKIDTDGTIHVKTVDTDYNVIEGIIKYKRPSLMYYYTDLLYKDFREGDYLTTTVLSASKKHFSIDDQLVQFLVEDCRENNGTGNDVLCKLIDVKPHQLGWLTDMGTGIYTPNDGSFKEKTENVFGFLRIKQYGDYYFYGKIDAEIVELNVDESFDEQEVRHDCITAFAESTKAPVIKTAENGPDRLDPQILHILMRSLFVAQKNLLRPLDKFRYLSNIWAMSVLLGDTQSESYIRFTATYLRHLVMFVRDGKIDATALIPDESYANEDSPRTRLEVIKLLSEYGRKDYSQTLAHSIEEHTDTNPMLASLARLIQTSNTMQGTLSQAALNIIKREIVRTLSLETEDDADLESEDKAYLGVESQTVEFKQSFVYPANNNMQPEPNRQMRVVCRGLCAFLNSNSGGTLYLGVNDQGYVCGLDNDQKYLMTHTIDSYMRYIQDNAQTLLGLDSMAYIRIEPLHDNSVVAIHVDPHPYRVVELEGKAYMRVNAESREMPENMRLELIDRKMLRDKEKAAAISMLQHAAERKKVVILHGYSSSNSLSVSNRKVEAYNVLPSEGLVFCFDYKDYKCKVFNISRIGYVEITDADWAHRLVHEDIKVDAFHMSGKTPIKVSLQLDIMAKNLLVEEFPKTKGYLEQDRNDPTLWYLTLDVYSIHGIGRFYAGLAGHIQILDCPELVRYIEDYKKLL